jgi:hypothetical protein
MCLANLSGVREVITAAATAEVDEDHPAICGSVVVHCVHAGEPLRLAMRMPDALLLLNALRTIEAEFDLEDWAERIGCSLNATDAVNHEVIEYEAIEEEPEPVALNS